MKIPITCFLLISTLCSIAQEPARKPVPKRNDISVNLMPLLNSNRLPGEYTGRSYIQYRRQLNPNWFAKVDLSSWITREDDNKYVYLSDTSRILLSSYRSQRYPTMRIGVERNVYRNIFTVGANIIGGRQISLSSTREHTEVFDTSFNDFVGTCTYSSPSGTNDCGYVLYTRIWNLLGASLSLNLNLDITDRWKMALVYEYQVVRHFDRGTKVLETENDPYLISNGNFNSDYNYSYWNRRHNIDLLLRFRF